MYKFKTINLILRTYLLVLSIFFVFRFILFISQLDLLDFQKTTIWTVFQAFIMGIRFDIVISGYIILFPTLLMLVLELFTDSIKLLHRFVFYWLFLFFTIAFMIAAADIPYFNQFYARFSIGAFEWMDNLSFVMKMIIQEPKYFLFILLFILIEIIFYKLLKRLFVYNEKRNKTKYAVRILFSLLFLGFIFLGIRGRVAEKSPIRIGTAYFSNISFLNKLGLNPVFTLMRSYLDSKDKDNEEVNLIDKKKAITTIQSFLDIKDSISKSPIARKIIAKGGLGKPNIILIIMESMSAAKMKRHGNTDNLTPFLDSLSYESLYFEQLYSAGKHTFNGIFSTLYSFPALYRQQPLDNMRDYNGLSNTLQENGYSTTFFITHDGQFDNMEGFLRLNKFEKVYSQQDYPVKEVKTTLGVPDDYLFRYSIPVLDTLARNKKPFLVAFMTGSDHGPYYVPPYFKPEANDIKNQAVQYADWSLKQFISTCKTKSWFDNTIFVFVADHGSAIQAKYDIALNYHHVPLLIYAPKKIEKQLYTEISSQIDIFPTIMGLTGIDYVNNTLGIDLLTQKRPFVLINDDDKFGVLDTENLLIIKKEGTPKMYNYKNKNLNNIYFPKQTKANQMELFGKANMQVYQYLLDNNLTKY
jgi:phosphoglycerol transferase MdoB-like AlkP superfamily enzyme